MKKYIILQAFRTTVTEKVADKRKKVLPKRIKVGEFIPAGVRYNLSDDIVNSREFQHYLKAGKIQIVEEINITPKVEVAQPTVKIAENAQTTQKKLNLQ